MAKQKEKVIRAALRTDDVTHVKVSFNNGVFTPEEFTSLFMAILETYTVGLLEKNSPEAVFTHFNNVFGIFLNKIVPEKDHYKLSKPHKEYKEHVDATLGRESTLEDKKYSEEVRMAAYLLAGDILTKEVGLTADAANLLLNTRLGLLDPEFKTQDEKK